MGEPLADTTNLHTRISKLENVVNNQQTTLASLQQTRLILGLVTFGLFVCSQIFKGLYLELVALFVTLPVFIFFLKKSRNYHRFIAMLGELKSFYQKQNQFRQGHFPGNQDPEEMSNPHLARDLDLGVMFKHLDGTFSKQGQNLLDSWLCQKFENSTRNERRQAIENLAKAPGLIRRLQMESIEAPMDYQRMRQDLERPLLEKDLAWSWVIPISWVLTLLFLLTGAPSLFAKIGILVYIGALLVYIGRTQYLFSRLQDIHKDFGILGSRIENLEKLASFTENAKSLQSHSASEDLKKLATLISFMSIKTNPILFYILNIIAPWDFFLTQICERRRKTFFEHFKLWSEEAHFIEAACCFANLAVYHQTTWAQESEGFVQVKGLSHPLISQDVIVTNDFNPGKDRIIIITGSNMSGKSTFLRALGINYCLASIGAPVFADEFSFQPMEIVSCIRVSDSLRDGQSYFYAEVKRMKYILEAAKSRDVLFLIDEPLRGTNNKERLIGNQSYLKQILATTACGFISTHDLELTRLSEASDQITNAHFSEQWEDKDLSFDYKIKHGPSQSTNALKILAREGLYQASP